MPRRRQKYVRLANSFKKKKKVSHTISRIAEEVSQRKFLRAVNVILCVTPKP